MDQSQNFWVFGYGSLIWRPGFEFVSAHPARLYGAHRSLCIYSVRYRGTPEKPGLVFGLVPGGSCNGMAFEVSTKEWPKTLEYLRKREQVTMVYHEAQRQVVLQNGRKVSATSYLVNMEHDQFTGNLSDAEQLALVRDATGSAGSNADYVLNTIEHLNEFHIIDRHLEHLAGELEIRQASE